MRNNKKRCIFVLLNNTTTNNDMTNLINAFNNFLEVCELMENIIALYPNKKAETIAYLEQLFTEVSVMLPSFLTYKIDYNAGQFNVLGFTELNQAFEVAPYVFNSNWYKWKDIERATAARKEKAVIFNNISLEEDFEEKGDKENIRFSHERNEDGTFTLNMFFWNPIAVDSFNYTFHYFNEDWLKSDVEKYLANI